MDTPSSAAERESVALWIAQRQGLDGSYSNMFAPTNRELTNGIRLFTGEQLGPSASLRHVSGEEACRALLLLNARSKIVQGALERATEGMHRALQRAAQVKGKLFFCCGTCDPSLWRHLAINTYEDSEQWLVKGMKALRAHRDGSGRWKRFPFYYTLLALSEIDAAPAIQEIKYAAPACEGLLKRTKSLDKVAARRRLLVERMLSRI